MSLEQITRLWPAVLDQLRQSSAPALAALFEGARPTAVDAEAATVTIGFTVDSTFNKRKAETPEQRERVAEALEAVTGERLRPVYVLLDGDQEGNSDEEHQGAGEGDLLERLKSEFDAEEVSEI